MFSVSAISIKMASSHILKDTMSVRACVRACVLACSLCLNKKLITLWGDSLLGDMSTGNSQFHQSAASLIILVSPQPPGSVILPEAMYIPPPPLPAWSHHDSLMSRRDASLPGDLGPRCRGRDGRRRRRRAAFVCRDDAPVAAGLRVLPLSAAEAPPVHNNELKMPARWGRIGGGELEGGRDHRAGLRKLADYGS